MTEQNTCECPTCKKRALLQEKYPEKEIGIQYAAMKLQEDLFLLMSAEELEYFYEGVRGPYLKPSTQKNKRYTLAYGVFRTQKNCNSDFEDLKSSKGTEYFSFDYKTKEMQLVRVVDYVISHQENEEVKVAVLIESDKELSFPESDAELATTLTKYMSDLGTKLTDLIFSRIENGIFRLDKGQVISEKQKKNWKQLVDIEILSNIEHKRFLLID
jgi:hypothetical protein